MQTTNNARWVYRFSNSELDVARSPRAQLGGKGSALAEMSRLGLPVPPGFTISAELCSTSAAEGEMPEGVRDELASALAWLEGTTGKRFDAQRGMPLLVSVRSGAAVSMPGMMDTILNLGLNQRTVKLLAELTADAAFAYDSYARFLRMYGTIVMGIDDAEFELAQTRTPRTAVAPATFNSYRAAAYEAVLEKHGGFPQDPWDQLRAAITAVFKSWNSRRAKLYRRMHGISDLIGTAVNVQAMVFGNLGERSGTGVAFTRSPNTGERKWFGEWLAQAQGEDIVAGLRTPQSLTDGPDSLKTRLPECFAELERLRERLETHFTDMQDIEFTIECGKLYVL